MAANGDNNRDEAAAQVRFQVPIKHIADLRADLSKFQASPAYREVVAFLTALNGSVRSLPISSCPTPSRHAIALTQILDQIGQWIDEIPPLASAQRYGNKAFRLWLGRLESEAPNLLRLLLPADLLDATVEVVPYFLVSFGDKTRIDYGTGHELNFIAFILCLAKLGVFGPNDLPVIVLHVFHHYLNLMRKLQTVYWLEPAGSKGVWGLDDYQFLAFYWGASQLIGCENDGITPSSIHSQAIVDKCVDDYLYFSCIRFITKMKRGRFEEYAPLLNDISAVPFWEKVNSGLLRMYYKEVLNKFPVVQHFLFGSILRYSSE